MVGSSFSASDPERTSGRDRRFLKRVARPTRSLLCRVPFWTRVAWVRAWARAYMRRREFVKLIASGAAVWPLAAQAQQAAAMPVIGFLSNASPDLYSNRLRTFRQGLKEENYV